MQITFEIPDDEFAKLTKLAEQVGVSPEAIPSQFIADLTASNRTAGSDERAAAAAYFRRTFE
jgi:predicted transcriptional regulator